MISHKKIFASLISVLFLFSLPAQEWVEEDPVEDVWGGEIIDLDSDEETVSEVNQDAEKYVLTIIEASQEHDLNPHTSVYASDAQILYSIYEGLFSYDPKTLEPLPAICASYKISRDKKRWTFTLRENACFSDGSQITADDVRNSWLELLSTPNASYSSMLDVIVGAKDYRLGKSPAEDVEITAVSPTVLSIRLNAPVSYLPKVLCHSSFAVTHRNPTVYSGSYAIADIKEGEIILQKNDFYWDAASVQIKMVCFFQSLGSEENAYMYNNGFADWISAYDVNSTKIINKSSIQLGAQFGTEFLFFKTSAAKPKNAKTSKVWDIPDFRQAVLEAMPWEKLRTGSLVPATTLVYPLSEYPEVEGYSYTDENEAVLLMNDAREKAGISKTKRIPLVMQLSENAFNEEQVEAMKNALDPLGVDLKINFIPMAKYLETVATCDADIVSYNWIGDFADPLAFLELFRGDSTLNVSGWKNDEFDSLIEKSSGISGKERYELLAQAETILLNDGIILPVAHSVSLSIINKNAVGGWYDNAFNIHPLKYIYKKDYAPKIPNVI